jgi:2-oxoglutarate ferredoxin oxidoreductase subunit alpha
MVVSGLEQDENEAVSYHPLIHTKMTEKRHRKLQAALENDIPPAERFGCDGKVRLGILSWGSTMGAVAEAVEIACEQGLGVAALKQVVLNPMNEDDLNAFCDDCEQILVPELNYSGQYADWLAMHISRPLLRMDRVTCRPLSYVDILEEIHRLLGE